MKQTQFVRLLSLIVCVVLTAAMALCASGCTDNQTAPDSGDVVATAVKGEGATAFTFEVTMADGAKTVYEIHTDKTTVGDALLELGLIDGDVSEYGLYVKTVDGVTLDYNTDGMYWAFYIGGEYAMMGVDTTDITAGETYAFAVTAA